MASFVATLRAAGITPHLAQKAQYTAIDGRTTRERGYQHRQRKRKLVEQAFGWMKTVGLTAEAPPPRLRTRRLDLYLHGHGPQPGALMHAGDGAIPRQVGVNRSADRLELSTAGSQDTESPFFSSC